ncbi:MAG TPA: glycosyltransferase family 9 protein [Bacteroidales bacterium]|nr:glycosyltransferase family 9 protein [Bacteroidales bacterium]
MKILVIRTSAMGDVALTVPVLAGFKEQHPGNEVILLTKKSFNPFFSSIGDLILFNPDFSERHKGIFGILKLFRDIRSRHDPDIILDLHDVIRSKLLRCIFRIAGKKVYVIDKGRSEKRALITGKKKTFLKHATERYSDVFAEAGFNVVPAAGRFFKPPKQSDDEAEALIQKDILNIGVAPFAMHKLKMWPEEYMTELLQLIATRHDCRIFIFGGREDSARAGLIQSKVPGCIIVSGKYSMETELALMKRLNLMIAMDSSNMHMAALAGARVVSIWGGTDPMAGFGPWMQPDNYAIRIPVEELDCRPCTIYGKGTSRRGLECMKRLTPDIVYSRIVKLGII